ncbi:hypothetical protein [Actinacidiphila oryziradicis]|nr:hypothetical protein [Actinacidiphila oryziradicis]
MSANVIDQTVEQGTETVVELPEIVDSQLVFDYGVQAMPTVCPSATARAV